MSDYIQTEHWSQLFSIHSLDFYIVLIDDKDANKRCLGGKESDFCSHKIKYFLQWKNYYGFTALFVVISSSNCCHLSIFSHSYLTLVILLTYVDDDDDGSSEIEREKSFLKQEYE